MKGQVVVEYGLALRSGFASHYAFLVKAQNFHWNVVGRAFYADHLLFERIYTEVDGVLDAFAENLRKAQVVVPAGLCELAELSVVEDCSGGLSASEMLVVLLADAERLATLFRLLFELAEEQGDHGLSNFFADRQDAYRQHAWMLRSSLDG